MNFKKLDMENSRLLLTTKEAAELVGVSRNNFRFYFVDTGAITPIYLPDTKHPRFYLKDVAQIPERMKEQQEAIRNSIRSKPRPQINNFIFQKLQAGL